MRRFFRNNGLTLVLMGLFLGTMVGQIATGLREHNNDQREHNKPVIGLGEYLTSGHFWEATAENWESEFLQMAMFVVLTIFLFQKGSPESKDPETPPGDDPVDNDPALQRDRPDAPWPVRKGGAWLWVYSNSLSLAFLLMFFVSFWLHARHGVREYNEDQLAHGGGTVTTAGYMGTSRFWFESFQNWQSEFLSLAAMVYLAVYLRQRGSAESKPVATPHDESGEDEEVIPRPASGTAPDSGLGVGYRKAEGRATART
jgi:hypothetical protein